jgi:ubiquinone/menaquinone biosynthesis C-methylase UbiE
MNQDKIFLKNEGNRWFLRNQKAISDVSRIKLDLPLAMIKKQQLKPRRVLEVGCSNGYRLEEIRKRYNAKCFGLEPSLLAIGDGLKRYPKIILKRGLINRLPFKDEEFDLVIVNYVFHWVDRRSILEAVKEINRVVKDGGRLLISDFLPDQPTKVPYHHLKNAGVFTYKLDYPAIFLASGQYKLASKVIFKHGERGEPNFPPESEIESHEKAVCAILKKTDNFNLALLPK